MTATSRVVLAVLAGVGALVAPRAARAEKETFTATFLRDADMRQSTSRTWPVTFHVESWTTEEELERLEAVLQEGGPDALLREFQKGKARAGYVVSTAMTREPSWRVAIATTSQTARGRVVRLLTDRPVWFSEAWSGSRSLDYPFAIFEFTLDEKGRGQGHAVVGARLVQEEDGVLRYETLPYTTGPDRLLGVRRMD